MIMPLTSSKFLIESLSTVNSTNETAIKRLRDGRLIDWIVAKRQLNGRGRRYNSWISPIGGLYATRVLSDPKIDYSHISQLSIITSVVAAKTIAEIVGKDRLQLKWPNDILLAGKKLCGILIETIVIENKLFLIIGFGINVRYPNNNPREDFSYLQDVKEGVNVYDCFNNLVSNFNEIINIWAYGKIFSRYRQYWLDLAKDHDKVIKVTRKDNYIEGIFENIDNQGNLILKVGDQIEIINTGEVFS